MLTADSKKHLRLANQKLRQLTSLSIHHITFNRHQHAELTGPDRRKALCLQLATRLPCVKSCKIDHIFSGPVSLVPKLLRQLPGLTKLDLFSSRPSPYVIKQLSVCSQLRELRVDHSSTDSLKLLPSLPDLQRLEIILRPASLSAKHLPPVVQYKNLQTLIIQTTGSLSVTECVISIEALSRLQHLHTLSLQWSSGRLSTSFSQLPHLTSLTLSGHTMSTPTVDSLLDLTTLHTLHLTVEPFRTALEPTAWQSRSTPPHFPHLTHLTLPMKLLAAPGCPRLPSLLKLTTSTSGQDPAGPDHCHSGLSKLPLKNLRTLCFSMETSNDQKAMQKVLELLVESCKGLQHLDLHGPLPPDAHTLLANMKGLRTLRIVTRVQLAGDRQEVLNRLNWLEKQLPLLESMSSTVNLPPTFVWFWNVMQLL